MIIMRKTKLCLLFLLLFLACSSGAMTLKDSIGVALKNNPSVVASGKNVDAADAKYWQAVGAFLPTVKLQGGYGQTYSQPYTMQFSLNNITQDVTVGIDQTADTKNWQASLTQPVFVAALVPGATLARKNLDVARESLRKTVLDTSFNVTQSYFGVIKASRMEKLAEESLTMAQSHLDQVREMLSAGVVTRADLLRSEVQVAQAEVGLTRAKNGLEIAKDAFNNSLGNDLEQPVALDETGFTGTVSSLPEYRSLLALALDNRPDWKQYQLSIGMSEDNLKIAQSNLLPSIMINANKTESFTDYHMFNTDINSWTITGGASWTLFDGLTTENKIKEAAASLDSQKATEDQVRNGIALEVRDAFLNLNSALETIGSTKKAVDSAEEGYKVSTQRYNSGVGTNLEVLDAQVALTQAKNDFLQSIFDVETAKAKIDQVVGKEVL